MPYLFLVIAALFLIEAITKLNNGEDSVLYFLFTGAAIFMFFFKRYQYRKFGNGTKK